MGLEKVQPKQAKKEMANAKASTKSTKKFALNSRSAKSWKKNRNASLASIQVEVSPPPGFFGFLWLPFPLGTQIDETATIAASLSRQLGGVIKINSKPKPINQRGSKVFGELYT